MLGSCIYSAVSLLHLAGELGVQCSLPCYVSQHCSKLAEHGLHTSAVHTVAQFVMSSCPKACHSRSDSFCLLFALCTRNE